MVVNNNAYDYLADDDRISSVTLLPLEVVEDITELDEVLIDAEQNTLLPRAVRPSAHRNAHGLVHGLSQLL